MKNLYLITDYRGTFYSDVTRERVQKSSMDISILTDLFKAKGFELIILSFVQVQELLGTLKGQYVIYQSSEDNGLIYKNHLDSLIYTLELAGAKLIPSYTLFKAHHNKVFMELLRKLSNSQDINRPEAKVYGTYEEFKDLKVTYPSVVKSSEGAGSKGVFLVKNKEEKDKVAKQISKIQGTIGRVIQVLKNFKYRNTEVKGHSLNRKEFLVQSFIPNLSGDYKVLIFDNKFYVLERSNRKNDFRASGSGIFNWPEKVPDELLNYSQTVFSHFNCPIASLDIAFDGDKYYLIEFQFLSFGPLTLSGSDWYFTRKDNEWTRVDGQSDYHEELVNAVSNYINK